MVLVWMGLIFFLSAQVATESDHLSLGLTEAIIGLIEKVIPGMEVGAFLSNHIIRKFSHFFAYLVLGVLTMNALTESGFTKNGTIAMTLVTCVLYAISDE